MQIIDIENKDIGYKIEVLRGWPGFDFDQENIFLNGIADELEKIRDSDYVSVVRCKTCKYSKPVKAREGEFMCDLHYEHVPYDYFCASGENGENE